MAIGPIVQTRLQILDPSGVEILDSAFQPGNVRDWGPHDAEGRVLPTGSYTGVLSARDLMNETSVKRVTLFIHDDQVSLPLGDTPAVAGSPIQEVLTENVDEATAATVTLHNGVLGRLVSTQGPLTLGTGNPFSASDKEHVRITPEGRVGIGTPKPEATLDVAGVIRTSGGIQFADGTVLTSAARTFESGLVGGSPSPHGSESLPAMNSVTPITASGSRPVISGSRQSSVSVVAPYSAAKVSAAFAPSSEVQGGAMVVGAGPSGSSIAFSNNFPLFIVNDSKANLLNNTISGNVILAISPAGDIGIGTGVANPQARLHVAGDEILTGTLVANGQIGIGTSTPGQKLTVAGTIESIGGGFKFPDGTIQTSAAGSPGGNVPVGTVVPYAGLAAAIPTGWLICDGVAVDRTQYAALFSALGTSWGNGDGSTTFNIPDLVGRFLRGVDRDHNGTASAIPRDPDRDVRTAPNAGGNVGNNTGSIQGDQLRAHKHGIVDPGHTHILPGNKKMLAVPHAAGDQTYEVGPGTAEVLAQVSSTVSTVTGISLQNTGGGETRPSNAYVIWIIKAN